MDQTLQRIQQWLADHQDDLLQDTVAMLRIPSLESDPEPNAPFGKENRRALDLALSLAAKYGMKTTDVEGFCGYGDFGDTGPLVASFGHIDVVPVGPGWKHEPFGAEIDGEYIYARGSVDDKGPTMASFYAIRAIHAVAPELKVRFRQFFGCNEESGFNCIHRYTKTEETPMFGVAPDSGWPLIHAEKGIAGMRISVPVNTGDFALLELTGGQRPNIVIDACSATVAVAPTVRKEIETALEDAWDKNVTFAWSENCLKIQAKGKAAHGAAPWAGDSAATRILRFLQQIAPLSAKEYFDELLWATHPSGVGLGIHGRDEVSDDLTSNLGIVATGEGRIVLTVNVRYPVTWKGTDLKAKCDKFLLEKRKSWKLDDFTDSPSLYFPLEHDLVKTIVQAYVAETGDTEKPGVMGGGTYARAVPNTVSIGTGWEGDGGAHETDERLKIEHLYKMSRIYAHILLRLAQVAIQSA